MLRLHYVREREAITTDNGGKIDHENPTGRCGIIVA
jgi:hypothetical protein